MIQKSNENQEKQFDRALKYMLLSIAVCMGTALIGEVLLPDVAWWKLFLITAPSGYAAASVGYWFAKMDFFKD